MGRVINTDSTGAQRSRLRRTIAECLNRLMAKPELDAEAKDIASLIVLALREITDGVAQSADVWDKRGYYLKSDTLRNDWDWADRTADRMGNLIRVGDWARLPVVLATLVPRFADVDVVKLTRTEALWRGAYARLLADETKRRAKVQETQ